MFADDDKENYNRRELWDAATDHIKRRYEISVMKY